MLVEPTILIEVLSRSTADRDRGAKWLTYQTLPTLQADVLVSQDERRIDLDTRRGTGWLLTAITPPEPLVLPQVPGDVPLDEIYESSGV